MAAFMATLSRPDLLTFDSGSYLDWSPSRTFAYPALLWLIGRIDPSHSLVPYVQMALLVASAALMVAACHALRPAGVVWALAGMAILANPFIWRYAMQILAESLYISLCMLFVAAAALALRARPHGLAWLGPVGVVLGLVVLTRPDGYSLLAASAIGVVLWRPNWARAGAALVGPALACLLLASLVNWVARGTFATQISGGYNLVGNVAFLIRPDLPGADTNGAARIAARLQAVSARLPPRTIAGARDHYWMTYFGYNPALHGTILPILVEEAGGDASARGEALSDPAIAKRVNALAWDISRSVLLRDPTAFGWHVAVHFAALWTFPSIGTAAEDRRVRGLVCAPALREALGRGFCLSDSMHALRMIWPRGAVVAKDLVLVSLMGLSFALIPAVFLGQRTSPVLALAGLAALSINAHHLLVALVEVGLERYALATWPFLAVMVAAAALAINDHFRRGVGARAPSRVPG